MRANGHKSQIVRVKTIINKKMLKENDWEPFFKFMAEEKRYNFDTKIFIIPHWPNPQICSNGNVATNFKSNCEPTCKTGNTGQLSSPNPNKTLACSPESECVNCSTLQYMLNSMEKTLGIAEEMTKHYENFAAVMIIEN